MSLPTAVLEHADVLGQRVAAELGVDIDVELLLGGRAALLGLSRGRQISAGGASRLLSGRDGWCALTLSRPDDIDTVPALAECDDVGPDPWPAVTRRVAEIGVEAFAERARLLGLPVGILGETGPAPAQVHRIGDRRPRPELAGMLVADLSSMWAGPLCGALLARAGATVVKVETSARPDGTRSGPPVFFDWMNAEKLSYRADFAQPAELRRLLDAADVVIESSRPGALERHGLGSADTARRDGRVWLRITGHGAQGQRCGWVAFGDDAAVSGGLVSGGASTPEFCADAIADPLTGLHATGAVLQSLSEGGGCMIDISMAAVAARYGRLARSAEIPCTVAPHRIRPAPMLGADNERVESLVARRLGAPC